MQDIIDGCGKGYSTQWAIKNLFGHLDRFALEVDVINKGYAQLTTAEPIPETSKEPFTDEEVNALWEVKDQEWVDSVLVFMYSGFRISELLGMKTENVDMDAGTFQGGTKTASGKNRIVPIHSKIVELVQKRHDEGNPHLFLHISLCLLLLFFLHLLLLIFLYSLFLLSSQFHIFQKLL